MKKIITSTLLTLCLASTAMASDAAFTLDEANQYCALPSNIIFTANRPTDPDSAGALTGKSQDGTQFQSYNVNTKSKEVMHPKGKLDINLQGRAGYGHRSGKVVTCFYTYTGLTTTVYASMNNNIH